MSINVFKKHPRPCAPVRLALFDALSGAGSNGNVFPYSLPSVGPGADPGVQAVSPQVT